GLEGLGGELVVGGEHGEGTALLLRLLQVPQADLRGTGRGGTGGGGLGAHGALLAVTRGRTGQARGERGSPRGTARALVCALSLSLPVERAAHRDVVCHP